MEPKLTEFFFGVAYIAAPMVRNDPDSGRVRLRVVSDEQIYNTAIRFFHESEPVNLDHWIPLKVIINDQEQIVYADCEDLAARLGLSSIEGLRECMKKSPNFIDETIKRQLRRTPLMKEHLDLFKLEGRACVNVINRRPVYEDLVLDETQVEKIYANILKGDVQNQALIAKSVLFCAERLTLKILLRHPELDKEEYRVGLKVVSFMVAHKNFHDIPYNNSSIAQTVGVCNEKLNKLEHLFLHCIDWETTVIFPTIIPEARFDSEDPPSTHVISYSLKRKLVKN